MWDCKHCNNSFNFLNASQRANHSRWCDKNPKKESYRSNENLAKAVNLSKDEKYGPKKSYQVTCNKCSKLFEVIEREKSFPSKDKYYCSRKCANSRVITEEHKKKTSRSMFGRYGRKYVEPREITAECKECHKIFTYIFQHRGRSFCTISCASKSHAKIRNATSRENRPALINYRADCAFKFNLKDYPDEFDFTLIEIYGWYKAKNRGNNLNGVSRDHMVSVRHGFDNNIPAEHLSHPANCRLILHNDNISKGTQNFITYEELLNRIAEWNKKYV